MLTTEIRIAKSVSSRGPLQTGVSTPITWPGRLVDISFPALVHLQTHRSTFTQCSDKGETRPRLAQDYILYHITALMRIRQGPLNLVLYVFDALMVSCCCLISLNVSTCIQAAAFTCPSLKTLESSLRYSLVLFPTTTDCLKRILLVTATTDQNYTSKTLHRAK